MIERRDKLEAIRFDNEPVCQKCDARMGARARHPSWSTANLQTAAGCVC